MRRKAPRSVAHLGTVLLLAPALFLVACNYGLRGGGGFPSHIRTIYVEPFENETPQFDIEQLIFSRLQDELPRSLGVRPAGREVADAILRGRITRYDDVANYQTGQTGQTGQGNQSNPSGQGGRCQGGSALEHEVRIGISAEIIDVENNVILWDSQGLSGRGIYQPGTETDEVGRECAIEYLVQEIIDGAQSQW